MALVQRPRPVGRGRDDRVHEVARLVLARALKSGAAAARRRRGQDGTTRRGEDDASWAKGHMTQV